MTKIIMAATADVWLINLPGLPRRHEVLTMEQLDDDTSHVVELLQTLMGVDIESTPTSHGGKDERVDVSLSFLLQSRLDLNAYRRYRRQADEQMESSSLLASSCFSFHKSRDMAGSCTAENSEKQNGETDGKGTSQPTVIMDWKAVGGTDNP